MPIRWTNMSAAGMLPSWCDDKDPRPAKEQINEHYSWAGGWQKFDGFTLVNAKKRGEARLEYPGDPSAREVSRAWLEAGGQRKGRETLILFTSDWVAVVQEDGSYEIARIS